MNYDEAAERLGFGVGGCWFVTVYSRERCYGGPEEGGWWYDMMSVVWWRRVNSEEQAHELVATLEAKAAELNEANKRRVYAAAGNLPDIETAYDGIEGYIPRHWSGGDDEQIVVVEEVLGSRVRQERPHYE